MAERDDFPARNRVGSTLVQPTGRGKLVMTFRRLQADGTVSPFDDEVYRSTSGLGLDTFNSRQMVYEDVQLTAWTTQDTERIQILQNHVDDGKVWSFGREVRTLTVNMVLHNTWGQRKVGTSFWNARGQQHWRTIMERGRISKLAEDRMSLNLQFDLLNVWGGFLESEVRIGSDAQRAIMVNGIFLVTDFRVVDGGFPNVTFPTTQFNGEVALSREGTDVIKAEELTRIDQGPRVVSASPVAPDQSTRLVPSAPARSGR